MIGEVVQETDRKRGLRKPEPPQAKNVHKKMMEASPRPAAQQHSKGRGRTCGNWACHGRYSKPNDKGKRGRQAQSGLVTRQAKLKMATCPVRLRSRTLAFSFVEERSRLSARRSSRPRQLRSYLTFRARSVKVPSVSWKYCRTSVETCDAMTCWQCVNCSSQRHRIRATK
jgi:hypothetical protein